MADREDSNALGELLDFVGQTAAQLMGLLSGLFPKPQRGKDGLPDEAGSQGSGCLSPMGCFGVLFVMILAAIVGLVVLLSLLRGGAESPKSTTDSPNAASSDTAAPGGDDGDLALLEGPWRIRNEELSVGGLMAPFVVVEQGTFTDAGGGRLLGTSGNGDTAIGFDLVSSSPTERVYTTTFMGAVYTLRFDAPGHFVGEVVLDGVLERRIEGWSELDEDGVPRIGLPDVGETVATTDADGVVPGGNSITIGSIAETCGVDWLPVELTVPGTSFEPQIAPNGDVACLGTYVDDGLGTARAVLGVEAGRLGLEFREEGRDLVVLGCAGGVGPIRFELTDWDGVTQIFASVDPRPCTDVFG